MSRAVIVLALAALLSPWAGASSAQVGRTTTYGASGGLDFALQCPDGHVLVGVWASSDKDLDAVGLGCVQTTNGKLTGYQTVPGNRTDPGPKSAPSGLAGHETGDGQFIVCPPGMAVEGIGVQLSAYHLIHAFWLQCRNMQTHQADTTKLSGYRDRGEAIAKDTRNCGGGAIAIGVFGGVEKAEHGEGSVRRLGLICKVTAAPAPTPPPPPKPKPKPKPADPPPFEINNDVHAPFEITNG